MFWAALCNHEKLHIIKYTCSLIPRFSSSCTHALLCVGGFSEEEAWMFYHVMHVVNTMMLKVYINITILCNSAKPHPLSEIAIFE